MSYDEWYTPREIIDLVTEFFGGNIDLDPASCEEANRVVRACQYYSQESSGLEQDWLGNVFLNPPYSRELLTPFIDKAIQQAMDSFTNQTIILVNNVTDTKNFHKLLNHSNSMCLIKGRLKFWNPARPAAQCPVQGQVLFYMGKESAYFRALFSRIGYCLRLNSSAY